MAVYVDPLVPALRNKLWPWKHSCHLYGDSEDELHQFAGWIGLRRAWFQQHPVLPHYDLTPNKRRQAVRAGAISVSRQELHDHLQALRQRCDA